MGQEPDGPSGRFRLKVHEESAQYQEVLRLRAAECPRVVHRACLEWVGREEIEDEIGRAARTICTYRIRKCSPKAEFVQRLPP